ncbi:MAG: matrixin family metalloprotease [Promethearchaeota archaeon]|jgi:predicted Zn-dependent protease
MKKVLVITFSMILLLSVLVTAGMLIPANDRAIEKSPVIGENGDLERVDFIHYAKPNNPGKPDKSDKNPKQDNCYKLMGVKWKTLPVDYVINPNNPQNLTEAFVTNTISTSAETWDDATSTELVNNNYTIDYNAKYRVQNFENAIVFGDYSQEGVIGVTSIWYTRRGKQIVEFDMLLDTDFDWGDAEQNPDLMDLENIVTHEFGHGIGLSDVYSDACSNVTMYGYSTEGEISKRTLEQPDITGLQAMYG